VNVDYRVNYMLIYMYGVQPTVILSNMSTGEIGMLTRTTSISEKRVGTMALKDTAITSKISQKWKNE
jgi:hypothetical protein